MLYEGHSLATLSLPKAASSMRKPPSNISVLHHSSPGALYMTHFYTYRPFMNVFHRVGLVKANKQYSSISYLGMMLSKYSMMKVNKVHADRTYDCHIGIFSNGQLVYNSNFHTKNFLDVGSAMLSA